MISHIPLPEETLKILKDNNIDRSIFDHDNEIVKKLSILTTVAILRSNAGK